MYQTTMSLEDAVGHILRHNIADAQGRKALAKGHRLETSDLPLLRALGVESLHVAVFEAGDVHEDEAARRLAQAVTGPHVATTAPAASRVNLLASATGIVRINTEPLLQLNSIEGLTIATRFTNTLVQKRQRIATIKIIPFAVPESALRNAEEIARGSAPIISLLPLRHQQIGIVLVSSISARARIERTIYAPIEARVTELGSLVRRSVYVASDEHEIANAIQDLCNECDLLIIAGETSIMDRDDVTPCGIRRAGGQIEHYGAPVEPGNLLLLAYREQGEQTIPILGAPGCVRSRATNIVDLLLPRLLAGEHITRKDIIALGHGGLL